MFKTNLIYSFLYTTIKYIIFFVVLAFIGNRFKHIVLDNAASSSKIFSLTLNYILQVSIYMIPLVLIFSFPIYLILKIKKNIFFLISITLFFTVEYYFYTFLYAPSNTILGVYNIVIGIFLLFIFFYKAIRSKFTGL